MIKKILLAIMIALPSMVFAQGKFGYVNTQELVGAMPEMKEVQAQLEASSKKYEDEFANLQAEFQKKFGELQAMDENTPKTIQDRRQQELQELGQKIEQFRTTASEDLQRQQQTLMMPIQEKVINALKVVGDEGSFTMIFENYVPVYTGNDAVDVTPIVKQKLGLK